jgi:magnesium-transporting ATPase (P-type)
MAQISTNEKVFLSMTMLTLFILCTLVYLLAKHIFNLLHRKTTTKVYNNKIYITKTKIFNFECKDPNLSENNTIHLTPLKYDGFILKIAHIIYGFFIYFVDPINIYYVVITIGQIWKYMDCRSLPPNLFFLIKSIYQHLSSVSDLLKEQFLTNNKRITKLVHKRGYLDNREQHEFFSIKSIKQKNLKRGDFLSLQEGDEIPADILLLNCTLSVSEYELTGEDIVISKVGVNYNKQDKNNMEITINHHENSGLITIGNSISTYTEKNILFAGTKIVDFVAFGLVIETGNDCRIYRINNDNRKTSNKFQKEIMEMCIINLYILLLLASVVGVVIYSRKEEYTYKKLWSAVFGSLLLFNAMVPMSLKLFYDESSSILSSRIEKKQNVKINRNGQTSFQINPGFIVTDKTGTITTGILDIGMIFTIRDDDKDFIPIIVKNSSYCNEIDNRNKIDILPNVLACTETQVHSQTKKIFKNDPIEEKLLSFLLDDTDKILVENTIDNEGKGIIVVERYGAFKRLFYSPFNHNLEVKIAVISRGKELILHIQGTPEAINKYSNNKLNSILEEINSFKSPDNAYKRIIAHACRIITEEELFLLREDVKEVLHSFNNVSVYVFYDYVVDGVDKTIKNLLSKDKYITLLTGDKMTSAIEIGETVGLIRDWVNLISIDNIEDLDTVSLKFSSSFVPGTKQNILLLNGRLLETITTNNRRSNLYLLIKNIKVHIIYRASPSGKQIFIAFLQEEFIEAEVMMIGDGLNDRAAIIQSNIGLAVRKVNNAKVQNIADIVIDSWTQLDKLLIDCQEKQNIIQNVILWVFMKHMITTSMLLSILVLSDFQKVQDPAHPIIMLIFNGIMFLSMRYYSLKSEGTINTDKLERNLFYIIVKGIIIGFINCMVIFSVIDVNNTSTGIITCIIVQCFELIMQLYLFYKGAGKLHFE